MPKTEHEQFRMMETWLASIIRKAELRSDHDPTAVEIADIARRCEAMVKCLVRNSTT